MSEPPDSGRRTAIRRDALLVAGVHVAVALVYRLALGITIVHEYGPEPWSWFWQNVPLDLLRERPLQSLWFLHAQPPLWNAVGAVLIQVFGGAHLHALQALNVLAGAATAGLCLALTARLTGGRGWALACGLVVALHPALFLFEAYALYTTLVAFAVVLAAWLLERARASGSPWASVGFVGVVVAVILTRSLFHLVLLAGALPLALIVSRRPPRAALAVLILLVVLPCGWYAKNSVQYGFFGGSSWYGMGLWRSALFAQDGERLRDLRAQGLLEPVVSVEPFSTPSRYRALGFDRVSDVPLLSRDDLHNVNVPAISESYYRSARALIVRTPLRYARNVVVAYGNFCAPSSDFAHLGPNRDRIGLHADVYAWALLRPVVQALERTLGVGYLGTVYFLLIPLAVAVPLARLARVRSPQALVGAVRTDAVRLYLAGVVAYTAAAGSALELGENTRFKFMIEPALIVLLVTLLATARERARSTRRGVQDGGLAS